LRSRHFEQLTTALAVVEIKNVMLPAQCLVASCTSNERERITLITVDFGQRRRETLFYWGHERGTSINVATLLPGIL
jgi:hypothetical protein